MEICAQSIGEIKNGISNVFFAGDDDVGISEHHIGEFHTWLQAKLTK